MAEANYLTIKEVAERLRISQATIRRAIVEGKLNAYQIHGWVWRIKESDFLKWIESGQGIKNKKGDE